MPGQPTLHSPVAVCIFAGVDGDTLHHWERERATRWDTPAIQQAASTPHLCRYALLILCARHPIGGPL